MPMKVCIDCGTIFPAEQKAREEMEVKKTQREQPREEKGKQEK